MRARATWETGREGKGLTSFSAPMSGSSCQPGKVARRMKVMKARTMATMLKAVRTRGYINLGGKKTYSRYGKTMLSLKVCATQMRLSGS